ncbi:MAG: penicillin-binding protein 1C [Myxococcota bacterium]|jgi:penicillin-binding protein 1C
MTTGSPKRPRAHLAASGVSRLWSSNAHAARRARARRGQESGRLERGDGERIRSLAAAWRARSASPRRLLARVRRILRRALVAGSVAVIAIAVWITAVPFPETALHFDDIASTRVVDRNGRLLRETLSAQEGRGEWLPLARISPHLVAATIHAEDKRFYAHAGIDGVAIARSAWINVTSGRAVTGASTLTQQMVKLTLQRDAPRTVGTKLMEAVWAMRLELTLSKDEILAQYLNRAPYGNQLFGAEAAARMYFDKPAADLSLAEAALLAGVPQIPTWRNPYRGLEAAKARQQLILGWMLERGAITAEAHARAVSEPLRILQRRAKFEAPQFVRHVLATQVSAASDGSTPALIKTTLDRVLQRRLQKVAAKQAVSDSRPYQVAMVVLDTQTSEVLSWVGSRDYHDVAAFGANDGVTALRQPGSALKPFVYGAYLEDGGDAATLVADIPTEFVTPDGIYRPQNFDRRFHGKVALREALASSLNVPAVAVIETVGVPRTLDLLRTLGFQSLHRAPEHYGLGLALGNGEVRLLDLAGAYATLGRLGRARPVTIRPAAALARAEDDVRLFSETTAYTLLSWLSDDQARGMGFGHHGPLALPYRMAAKTGTSSDFRDNWAVGVTPDYTVAVWVGHFDGRPMDRVSGNRGAAPLLRQVFQTLYPDAAGRGDVTWFKRPEALVPATLCKPPKSAGEPACAATWREWVTRSEALRLDSDTPLERRTVADRRLSSAHPMR